MIRDNGMTYEHIINTPLPYLLLELEHKQRIEQVKWARTRLIATYIANSNSKRKIKPQDILKLPLIDKPTLTDKLPEIKRQQELIRKQKNDIT